MVVDWIVGIVFGRLLAQGEKIMAKVQELGDQITAQLDRIHAGIVGVGRDVAWLKEQLSQLPSDDLTPQGQAILTSIVERVTQMAGTVEELDSATVPPTSNQG